MTKKYRGEVPMKWIDGPSATEMDNRPSSLNWTQFNKTFWTGTIICYKISSISVALGILSISVALGPSIHFIGTSSIYTHECDMRRKTCDI